MSVATRNLLLRLAILIVLWLGVRAIWNGFSSDKLSFVPTTGIEFIVCAMALAAALTQWFAAAKKEAASRA